jgi:hypothetical protein
MNGFQSLFDRLTTTPTSGVLRIGRLDTTLTMAGPAPTLSFTDRDGQAVVASFATVNDWKTYWKTEDGRRNFTRLIEATDAEVPIFRLSGPVGMTDTVFRNHFALDMLGESRSYVETARIRKGEGDEVEEVPAPAPSSAYKFATDVNLHSYSIEGENNNTSMLGVTAPLHFDFLLSRRFSGRVDLPISFMNIAGTKICRTGLTLAFPVKITEMEQIQDLRLTVTPFLGYLYQNNTTFNAQADMFNYGFAVRLEKTFGALTAGYGGYLASHYMIRQEIDGFETYLPIHDTLTAHSLKASYALKESWIVDGYLAGVFSLLDNNLPGDKFWPTVGAGINYRQYPPRSGFQYLRCGAAFDLNRGFTISLTTGFEF